jgi:two-component system, chemotaxis family, chemotaxis protein CheY
MGYNILIVDDSATTRAMIKRTLVLAQVPIGQLYDAADGKDALDILTCLKVDIVLADLNMPNMTGAEMTRLMRADPLMRGTPVIVISAEPNAEKLMRLKDDGVQACIRKPFTPEIIRDTINNIIGERTHA